MKTSASMRVFAAHATSCLNGVIRSTLCLLGTALVGLILSPAALAETKYEYTGQILGNARDENPPVGSYSNCGTESDPLPCRITGYFTTAEPLAYMVGLDIRDRVTHFAFSDGRTTLLYWNDPENPDNPVDPNHFAVEIANFQVWTDYNTHEIIGWSIWVRHDQYVPDRSMNPLHAQRYHIRTGKDDPRDNFSARDIANVFECTASWQPYPGEDRWDCAMHGIDEGRVIHSPGTWSIVAPDSDGDGVPDDQDICAGGDDNIDTDNDTVPDFCDTCPLDYYNDSDGDGSCDSDDLCLGDDSSGDSDADGLCDDSDPCWGASNSDEDADGICDEGDLCFGDDASGNSDGDGVCDDLDACEGDDATGDTDGDLYCDDLDACDFDVENDADNDGICETDDNCDLAANSDQSDYDSDGAGNVCDEDDDNDGIPDAEDPCPLDDTNSCAAYDADADGVPDADDQCLGTAIGAIVNGDGCSIDDLVPCEQEWKNHGAYVRSMAHAANDFLDLGLISDTEHEAIVAASAESDCGHRN